MKSKILSIILFFAATHSFSQSIPEGTKHIKYVDAVIFENGDTLEIHSASGYFYFKNEEKFDGVLALPHSLLEFDNWDYAVIERQIIIPFVQVPFVFSIVNLEWNKMQLQYTRDLNGQLNVFSLYFRRN